MVELRKSVLVFSRNMETRGVAETVCRMASDFYRLRDISMLDLLKCSGYLEDPSTVSDGQLEDVLRTYPELIDAWLRLCDDQRTRYGWCLLRPFDSHGSADWIVVEPNGKKQLSFPNSFKACAFFVRKQIEAYEANIGQ